eukprot:scaffold191592_cov32-Tisochrysis_lutea.AAC.2
MVAPASEVRDGSTAAGGATTTRGAAMASSGLRARKHRAAARSAPSSSISAVDPTGRSVVELGGIRSAQGGRLDEDHNGERRDASSSSPSCSVRPDARTSRTKPAPRYWACKSAHARAHASRSGGSASARSLSKLPHAAPS